MDEIISATEAKRTFSKMIRAVEQGRSYIITMRGEPVARIVPVRASHAPSPDARDRLLARLSAQPVIDIGPWTRDELHEDE